MNTRETVQHYFDLLSERGAWQTMLADDLEFSMLTAPAKQVSGKPAYLDATRRFYASIGSLAVRELIVDGDRACGLTRYQIQTPTGDSFESYVAEFFTVRDGRITSLSICFDTAPYPKTPNA